MPRSGSRSSRTEALEVMAGWRTGDVVALLQKHGVEEACWKAVEKRQIDGDELLHLTEGKLALWKSDLTRPLIWSLWAFVEELKKCPENYVEDESQSSQPPPLPLQPPPFEIESRSSQLQLHPQVQQVQEAEALSDCGSWDTDFEDSVDEVEVANEGNIDSGSGSVEMGSNIKGMNPDFRNSLRLFQENDRIKMENDKRGSTYSLNRADKPLTNASTPPLCTESTLYANCYDPDPLEPESTYANVDFADPGNTPVAPAAPRNPSRLHSVATAKCMSELQKSLADKLKEQLALMGAPMTNQVPGSKPVVAPKPEALMSKRNSISGTGGRSEPRTSFLYQSGKSIVNGNGSVQNKPINHHHHHNHQHQTNTEDSLKNLPKPPVSIRGFDLVANLPTTRHADESEDEDEEEEYEAFDEQIVEQHQLRSNSMARADSGQSLMSNSGSGNSAVARPNSVESVYVPPSSLGQDEEEVYEIYESITESPEENGHDYKIESKATNVVNPPPLPAKPPPNITALQNHVNKTDSKTERSVDKKSATLPHAGSNTSLNNAARPLPPPPDKQSYYERPWFHNLTRDQANCLIEEQCTYGNASDGYFLMRPSTTNPNNPLTLVLWCRDRVYNVPVRRRPDNRYALGSSKPDEQSFASIDEIIPFYKREKLVLYAGGVQTGSTRLSDTPQKEK